MGSAKDINVQFIGSREANALCKLYHYSGKVVPNSQLHLGVFYNGNCEGVMQYGPSMDKPRMAKSLGIDFHEFLELNRMAFSDVLPKNSESRAISVAHKLLRKHYPQLRLILSFADGCQCGDGTIYRAAGFRLLSYKKNKTILKLSDEALAFVRKYIPDAQHIIADKTLDNVRVGTRYLSSVVREYGYEPLEGTQFKYIYCLDPTLWDKYTYVPFAEIKEMGLSMYKGVRQEHESNAT